MAADELQELLGEDQITEKDANTVIMAAREHWFAEEDAQKAAEEAAAAAEAENADAETQPAAASEEEASEEAASEEPSEPAADADGDDKVAAGNAA